MDRPHTSAPRDVAALDFEDSQDRSVSGLHYLLIHKPAQLLHHFWSLKMSTAKPKTDKQIKTKLFIINYWINYLQKKMKSNQHTDIKVHISFIISALSIHKKGEWESCR